MKKAFTLLELIIVVIIMGILISIAIPTFRVSIEKARTAEAISILGNIRLAQTRYFTSYGAYTWEPAKLDITVSSSRFFYFAPLPCDSSPGMTCAFASAERISNPEDWQYTLYITKDGDIYCDDLDGPYCVRLGIQELPFRF